MEDMVATIFYTQSLNSGPKLLNMNKAHVGNSEQARNKLHKTFVFQLSGVKFYQMSCLSFDSNSCQQVTHLSWLVLSWLVLRNFL